MVTIAPSMASMLSNLGIAMISLDFSATFTCPSTMRWRAAKAETMWIGAMSPVLRPDRRTVLPSIAMTPSGDAGHRGHPGDEAVLELFGIERCEDVANPVVRWRPILEGAEAA